LTDVVLAVRGVVKRFGTFRALDGVELEVGPGTVHALCGGNGSGKSTLIKALAGVQPADEGEIRAGSVATPAAGMTPQRARHSGLRFVHQQPTTFEELTVGDNLALGSGYLTGALGRIRAADQRRRAAEVLARFKVDVDPDDLLGSLSATRRVMVTIARALQDRSEGVPSLLVLDEPTAALGGDQVDDLLGWLRERVVAGDSVLYVTHRLAEVVAVADAATVLRDGRVVGRLSREQLSEEALTEAIVGASVARRAAPAVRLPPAGSAPALRVTGLAGGRTGPVDLEIRRGEIVGLAGPLGAGRSTLLRLITGGQVPEAGRVEVLGRPVPAGDAPAAVKAGIGFVPEDRTHAVFAGDDIAENLTIAHLGHYWSGGRLRRRRQRADAAAAVREFAVRAPRIDAPVDQLSGGNQQKVVLARWMSRDTAVLVLDEPTQGVDVGARAEIHELIGQTAARGSAILAASADAEELARLCHRVLVMRGGRVTAQLEGSDLAAVTLDRLSLGAAA
jgi:ribose transport system ATP-binding protein